MQFEFKLPDIGEGIAEGEILRCMVKEGDKVKEDQSLVEVMTDKVNVQLPSPKEGVVSKVLVKDGDIVKVGEVILVMDVAGESRGATRRLQFDPAWSRPRARHRSYRRFSGTGSGR